MVKRRRVRVEEAEPLPQRGDLGPALVQVPVDGTRLLHPCGSGGRGGGVTEKVPPTPPSPLPRRCQGQEVPLRSDAGRFLVADVLPGSADGAAGRSGPLRAAEARVTEVGAGLAAEGAWRTPEGNRGSHVPLGVGATDTVALLELDTLSCSGAGVSYGVGG